MAVPKSTGSHLRYGVRVACPADRGFDWIEGNSSRRRVSDEHCAGARPKPLLARPDIVMARIGRYRATAHLLGRRAVGDPGHGGHPRTSRPRRLLRAIPFARDRGAGFSVFPVGFATARSRIPGDL